jgi:hypothetical protein
VRPRQFDPPIGSAATIATKRAPDHATSRRTNLRHRRTPFDLADKLNIEIDGRLKTNNAAKASTRASVAADRAKTVNNTE